MRPDALTYRAEFISPEEESRLIRLVETLAVQPVRMKGGVGKRETIHFGWDYDYDGWRIREAPPPPDALASLIDRCASAASIARERLAQVMVARYPPGAAIGWHRDAPMFGTPVIGISLGAACEMRFRRARGPRGSAARRSFDTYALRLEPRSLYLLDDEVRRDWQHSIPPVTELRYSITMRTLRNATEK